MQEDWYLKKPFKAAYEKGKIARRLDIESHKNPYTKTGYYKDGCLVHRSFGCLNWIKAWNEGYWQEDEKIQKERKK